tara:strand:+ start:274 stop:1971 length:1698 start_codon:yes stop_codon:yes gene_type:complete
MTEATSKTKRSKPSGLAKLGTRLKRRGEVTALDIDKRMLRVVHVTSSRGTAKVSRVELIPVPTEDFDLQNPKIVGEWIGDQLKAIRLTPGTVVMAVRRGEAVLKEFQLPPLKDIGEMASMVRMRASRELPFPESQASIDFTVTKAPTRQEIKAAKKEPSSSTNSEAKADVVVSAIKNETLDYYKTVAESAGFTLAGLGLRPMASYRALNACVPELKNGTVALVSVRRHEVDVDILIDGRLVFSRELSADLNLPDDCLELERNERLNQATKEIFRCLHSYEGSETYQKVDQLFVSGGTGLEEELCEQIQSGINTQCSRMPLPTGIRLPENKKEDASRALTSLGLALGFVDEGGLAVNFLSPKRPVVRRNEGRTKWLLGVCLLLASLVMLFSFRSRFEADAKAAYNSLTPQYTKLKKDERANKIIIRTGNAVTDWQNSATDWLGHFAFLSSVLPQCDKVYLTSMGSRRAGSNGILSFQLQAKDSDTLHSVEKSLRELGYSFKSVPHTPGNDRHGYSFRASFDLLIPSDFEHDIKENLKTNTPPARIEDDIHAKGLTVAPKRKDPRNG